MKLRRVAVGNDYGALSDWFGFCLRPMHTSLLIFFSVAWFCFFPPFLARAKAQPGRGPVTTERVEKAIDAAVGFLLRDQLDDGGWPEFIPERYDRGVSSLVTLALLNAGVELDHPKMVKALSHISARELAWVYTVSVQTMALCTANPNKYADIIRRNAKWLIKAQQADGGWAYDEAPAASDPSNSQFALLALHEAQRSGVANFPQQTWNTVFERSNTYWEELQFADGSFPYREGGARGSMTCAGIASLVIAGSQTRGKESSADQTIACCGNEDANEDRIEQAMQWLARNFSITHNPNFTHYYHYYMYALERVGRLTGQRYIGDHDWYREGAEYLIATKQDPIQGKFRGGNTDGNEYSETSFALLFLSKGKRKTLISRLDFPSAIRRDWNHHSAAIQHLTAHTELAWKRDLSWQVVDIERANLKELLETPVLFISGTKSPQLTTQQKRLLKEYVDGGGFIFAEGCKGNGCDGSEFEEYFRTLVIELWDKPLEPLPPNHPIWYAEGKVQPDGLPQEDANIYGVQTCCRLGVVYVPYSLSCRWELNVPYGAKPDYNERVKKELDTATLIGLNVLAYATGKELKEKLDAVTILEEVKNKAPTERGVFLLPKLQHNAGFDDASQAIPNLVQWLNKESPFLMSSEKKIIPITSDSLANHPVVFMHGRGELRFTSEQRQALKEFFENDGFLFADAICADEAFVESFRREMEIIVGEELDELPASHPLLSRQYGGFQIRDLRIIDPNQAGGSLVAATRRIPPRLQVARQNGRIVAVFSPLDLSCALESRHSMQCRGYFREDAARLGINVILFALQQE